VKRETRPWEVAAWPALPGSRCYKSRRNSSKRSQRPHHFTGDERTNSGQDLWFNDAWAFVWPCMSMWLEVVKKRSSGVVGWHARGVRPWRLSGPVNLLICHFCFWSKFIVIVKSVSMSPLVWDSTHTELRYQTLALLFLLVASERSHPCVVLQEVSHRQMKRRSGLWRGAEAAGSFLTAIQQCRTGACTSNKLYQNWVESSS
jgi:hypothetical protein